jgi:septum formation topological specificity factor MinE
MSDSPEQAIDRAEIERLREHILAVANGHLKIEQEYVLLQGELHQARRDIAVLKKEIERIKRVPFQRTNAGDTSKPQ